MSVFRHERILLPLRDFWELPETWISFNLFLFLTLTYFHSRYKKHYCTVRSCRSLNISLNVYPFAYNLQGSDGVKRSHSIWTTLCQFEKIMKPEIVPSLKSCKWEWKLEIRGWVEAKLTTEELNSVRILLKNPGDSRRLAVTQN